MEALSPGVTVPGVGWRDLSSPADGGRPTQSALESPKISGPSQVPGSERHAVPISYNTFSVACRQGGNETCGSGGPRVTPALPELCSSYQHCIATCSRAFCWGTCLLHLLHITPWAASSSPSQGEQKPSSMTKYYNLNPRNPTRTWPCTTTCRLSEKETVKATIAH